MPRRARLGPDTRPSWQDAPAHLSQAYLTKIKGEQELLDRMPAEARKEAWEGQFMSAYQAYQRWRSAQVRGSRKSTWDTGTALGAIIQRRDQ